MVFVNLCESLGKKVQSKQVLFYLLISSSLVLEKNGILLTWHKSSVINKDSQSSPSALHNTDQASHGVLGHDWDISL